MKALIIEDEPQAISALKQELSLNCPEILVVDVAQTVKNGIFKINEHNPDVVFLDIQLSDGLGFDILKAFEAINFKVIFTTAYSKYALQAIKFSALDYLLKPISAVELRLAVSKISLQSQGDLLKSVAAFIDNQNTTNEKKRIALQTSEGIFFHNISEIIRCNSDGNYTHIYLNNSRKLLIVKTLKEFEELLVPLGFERIHHSHLINLNHLSSYINKDGGYVVMSDKSTLPVSQRKKSAFIKKLDGFY